MIFINTVGYYLLLLYGTNNSKNDSKATVNEEWFALCTISEWSRANELQRDCLKSQ